MDQIKNKIKSKIIHVDTQKKGGKAKKGYGRVNLNTFM